MLGCVSLAAGGDLRALTEGSGHDRKGGAEDQDGDAATDDLLKRGKRKLEKEPFIELFFVFPSPARTGCVLHRRRRRRHRHFMLNWFHSLSA